MLPSCGFRCCAGRHSRAEVREEQEAFSRTAWAACPVKKGWWFSLIWSAKGTFCFSSYRFQEQSSSTFSRFLMSLSTHSTWCPLEHYSYVSDQNWQFPITPKPSLYICNTEHGFYVSAGPALFGRQNKQCSLFLPLCYHYSDFAGKVIFYFFLGHYSRQVYWGRWRKMWNRVEKPFDLGTLNSALE